MATLALDRPAPGGDEPALQRGQGRVALSGNELIVKGALEGGVSLITGYPGSPVADVFTICERAAGYLRTLGVEASIANNEAQSAAMLNGARQVPGARPMAIFKSVGAYVALDALAIANSARPAAGAGAVVVVGDDPEMSSTQVGADSRLTLSAARIPVLEPSSWQGLKELVTAAFELSVESELVVAVMLTTIQADGGGVVELGPNRPPAVGPLRRVALDTRAVRSARAVSLPPQVTELTNDLLERRVPLLHEAVRARGLDVLEGPREPAPIGFVTAGASYTLLRHALYALGIDGRLPVLRLALTSPIDPVAVRRLAGLAGEVVVVEERSGHLEDQVRRVLGQQAVPVWGKRFPGDADGLPEAGALDPDLVAAALGRLVLARPAAFPAPAPERARALAEPPPARAHPALLARTPTYCAGCPHRGTNSPILEIRERLRDPAYMRREHGRGPVDLIAHGGIGCYSMAMLPPFEEMHDLSAMGLGGATGAGSAPHTTNKHYTLVGDGSFFHGEMSTITNAIKQRQDILFIILDNKTTAMTGHQGTPGSDRDLMGRPQTPLEIERIVAAMGPTMLVRSNPDDREAHMALLERAVLAEGTRVVIADKECAITSGRRKRAERARVEAEHGFRPEVTRINVVEEVCENCRECTTATGCPGLTVVQTALGEKIGIDDQVCVDDGYCAAIKACPSFERVTVTRRSAPVRPAPARPEPPEPDPPPAAGSAELAVHVAGVGGLGIALVTRVVVEAAAEAWPGLDVYQKRGMAQRGGGVYSQIVLHDGARPRSPAIPRGRADLIIGLDALEGTRALDVASPDRTVAVVDTHRRQTTTSLMGVARYPDDLRERLSSAVRPGGLLALDLSAECAREFGDAIHANVAALGAAWQRGWLPLERAALERAIRSVYGAGAKANLRRLRARPGAGRRDAGAAPARGRRDRPGPRGRLDPQAERPASLRGGRRARTGPGARRRRARHAGPAPARAAGLGRRGLRRPLPGRHRARRGRRAGPDPGGHPQPASGDGDQGRGLRRPPTHQPAQAGPGPRAVRRRPAPGRPDLLRPSQPALVRGARADDPLQHGDPRLAAAAVRPGARPAPAAAGLARPRAGFPRLVRGRGDRGGGRRPAGRRGGPRGAAPARAGNRLPRGALPQGGRGVRALRRTAGGRRRRRLTVPSGRRGGDALDQLARRRVVRQAGDERNPGAHLVAA